jgi:hypothetical protein
MECYNFVFVLSVWDFSRLKYANANFFIICCTLAGLTTIDNQTVLAVQTLLESQSVQETIAGIFDYKLQL